MYTQNIILLNEKEYFCISKDAYILGKFHHMEMKIMV